MNKNQANHQIIEVKKHNKLCPISFGNRIAGRGNSIDKKKTTQNRGMCWVNNVDLYMLFIDSMTLSDFVFEPLEWTVKMKWKCSGKSIHSYK